MAQKLDSSALDGLRQVLGIAGGQGLQTTELLDGSVETVLDVGPFVRRGRTLARTQGIFAADITNEHAGAGSIATAVTPYSVGSADVSAPFPAQVPPDYDLWLIGAGLRLSALVLTRAILQLDLADHGFSVDSGGGGPFNLAMTLASWDTDLNIGTVRWAENSLSGTPFQHIGLRLPRGTSSTLATSLSLHSQASGAGDITCTMILAMLPAGLGQDAAI